jgi:hypothetical protein
LDYTNRLEEDGGNARRNSSNMQVPTSARVEVSVIRVP